MAAFLDRSIKHDELKEVVQRRLADVSLLAKRQQLRSLFSPSLSYGRHFGPPWPTSRPAAVMILMEPREGQWCIPLTVRPQTLQDHPGQISFPGGRLEAGETHQQAAEREFGEELGVAPFPGDICGELQPLFVYNSNYHVHPFVAICDRALDYRPCPVEVDRVIHLPLASLTDPTKRESLSSRRGLASWISPSIRHEEDRIWGATAIMLGELAALLEDLG
jgi:8-oxo-dGTP pyrophosphatase MutT (NUDIX family)